MHVSIAGASGPRLAARQQMPGATSRNPSKVLRSPPPTPGIEDGSPASTAAVTNFLATAAHANPQAELLGAADVPTALERRGDSLAGDQPTAAANWGMAVVYAMLSYEWLLSGLNKSLSGTYRAGLANRIHGSLVDNPHGWYVSIVTRGVLPHIGFFAAATLIGELLVAAGLIWGALLWLRPGWFPAGFRPWLGIGVTGALAGAALMEFNYYLLAGEEWPWLKTHDPFNVGLSVDGLVLLISLALIPVQLAAVRVSFAQRSTALAASNGNRTR
jgi:thiosulfate dehydrogenase (quinone) large subunit